jgi:hypothetical protein
LNSADLTKTTKVAIGEGTNLKGVGELIGLILNWFGGHLSRDVRFRDVIRRVEYHLEVISDDDRTIE